VIPGLRRYRQATLRVALAEGLPPDWRDGYREIISVQSESQGKGHAAALMYRTCAEADDARLALLIQVRPFAAGLTVEQLEKFYGRFGFERVQADPLLMARQPMERVH